MQISEIRKNNIIFSSTQPKEEFRFAFCWDLEIMRKHYFYLVERKDEKEAAKEAIRKNNQVVKYFSTKGRKF